MRIVYLVLATAVSVGAAAHTNEILSKRTGPHGGQMRVAAQYHLELALLANEMTVWVMDHADRPQATAGAQAQAIVTYGRERVVVNLAPAGDNKLTVRDKRLRVDKNARIVLNLTMTGQATAQARFAPVSAAQKTPPETASGHAH